MQINFHNASDSLDEFEDDDFESQDLSLSISSLNDRKPLIGRVCIYRRTTGKIGRDQEYQFSVNLQFWDGKPLQLSPHDLYYPVQVEYQYNVTVKTSHTYLELPSSLFAQAKLEQDRVGFVYQK